MLTWEDDVEVHALATRGWTISAIARHTGFDRKTVRKYLAGDGTPGVRARPDPDPFDPFVDYVTASLTEDPHLWARTLFDELEELGFGLSYQSLTRNIRARGLRLVCEACRTATERPNAVIPHAPGRGNPMGLAGIAWSPAVVGVGKDRAPAGRLAVAFREMARLFGVLRGSAAPGRRPGPHQPRTRRVHPGVAV